MTESLGALGIEREREVGLVTKNQKRVLEGGGTRRKSSESTNVEAGTYLV